MLFDYFKRKKQEKLEAKRKAEEQERLRREAARKAEEQERKRIEAEERAKEALERKEFGDYYYDHKRKQCNSKDDYANFWEKFYNDKEFWHGNFNTAFSEDRGGAAFVKEVTEIGFNNKNPFVKLIIKFLENRQSESERIDSGSWTKLHNFLVNASGGDDIRIAKLVNEIFAEFDYKVLMLPYDEFERFLKNLEME